MNQLSHHDVAHLLLALAVLLGTARLLGELALRFRQPAVLGELFAGILLGPTILGTMAPTWSAFLFPSDGNVPLAINALTTLAITLFLLVAGMEVDLSTVWRQGRAALIIGTMGIVLPFALGFGSAWFAPKTMGAHAAADPLIFALFFATALSISALPVIAKTLMDLNLFRTDFGMVVVAAAILNDLVGWIIFAIILGMMGEQAGSAVNGGEAAPMPIAVTIGLTLGFVAFMLTLGRWLIDRILPWLQAHASWPGGVLGFALTLALFCAAFTEWIGIHAIFGAFIFGIALGDSRHLRERTRATIDQFISFIFAPLFFAGVGLTVNFITGFDPLLVLVVLVVATIGKVAGCGLGAWWSGFSPRESWATGAAMNSRGVMEIILGVLALKKELIDERMFVALVVMALVTSMTSGPLIQFCLRQKKKRKFTDYVNSKSAFVVLQAHDRRAAITELVTAACVDRDLHADRVTNMVWLREQIAGTSLDRGVAAPHARLEELEQPVVAIGVSPRGIDWDSSDGEPTHVVALLLTPKGDDVSQLELLADVANTFRHDKVVSTAKETKNYVQFLACIKSADH